MKICKVLTLIDLLGVIIALTKLEATPSTSACAGEDVLTQLGTKDFIHYVNHTLGLAATTQADPAQLYLQLTDCQGHL